MYTYVMNTYLYTYGKKDFQFQSVQIFMEQNFEFFHQIEQVCVCVCRWEYCKFTFFLLYTNVSAGADTLITIYTKRDC